MRHYTFTVAEDTLTTGETVFVVRCPELFAFMTQGLTVDAALLNAVELLREWYWPDVPLASEAVATGADGDWRWAVGMVEGTDDL